MRYDEIYQDQQKDKHSAHCPKYSDVIEAQSFSMDFENLDSQEPPAKRARQETEYIQHCHVVPLCCYARLMPDRCHLK